MYLLLLLLYTEMDTYRFQRPQDNIEHPKRLRRRYLPKEQPNATYEFTYKCYQCGQPYNLELAGSAEIECPTCSSRIIKKEPSKKPHVLEAL